MNKHASEGWFEDIQIEGRQLSNVSKFWRTDFTISLQSVENRWPAWSSEEREWFAFAFSKRPKLNDEDEKVLTYIITNGEPGIWRLIALLATNSRNRRQVINFLIARVKQGDGPLANYYQALGRLRDDGSVAVLKEALAKHTDNVQVVRSLVPAPTYRAIFLDYIACCATLFLVTRQGEYRDVLRDMAERQDTVVSKLARMVAAQSGITLV